MSLSISQLQAVTYQRKSTSSLLQYADNNRNQGRFNDVTIRSADTSIPANRMVLSCYCLFFDKIFASKTNDQVNDLVVDVPDVDGKSLELLIQYFYTGQICIDSDNVLDILSAAHHLKLDEVKEFCFELLENCITSDNCITILITAKQYKNFTVRDKVYKHISENYETITKTPAFLNLENDELFFIVYHLKRKFYVSDEALCRSLLSWTKQDEKTRKQHLQSKLFTFVNVDQLSYSLVRELLNESLICSVSEYFDLLNARMELLKSSGRQILSIGGYYEGKKVKLLYSLDNKTNVVYPDLPIPLYYHGTLRVNDFVYCIGGRTTNLSKSNKVIRLNLNEVDMKWNEMPELNNKRFAPGTAAFKNTLVVCGGYDGQKWLSSSEAYIAELNKWNPISSLKQSRSGNQSATIGGYLYTMGGWDGRNYLSSVEQLDDLDRSWKSVCSMQTPRSWFAAVSCNDVMYVIGGLSGAFNILKSVEKYDCAADKWMYVSEMNIERHGHSACVMEGKIFVVGGRNADGKPVKEIESYNPSTDKWEIVARIDEELIGHTLAVVGALH